MEEIRPESVYKSINREKYAIDETENEEPLGTDNTVVKEPRYFNIFECGKKILNRLDATCKQACMVTSRYKYYTEMFNNLTDYNDRNNAPISNQKIQKSMHKVMDEESILNANNVTADTFSHKLNTQRYNANAIFTSEKLDKSDKMA